MKPKELNEKLQADFQRKISGPGCYAAWGQTIVVGPRGSERRVEAFWCGAHDAQGWVGQPCIAASGPKERSS